GNIRQPHLPIRSTRNDLPDKRNKNRKYADTHVSKSALAVEFTRKRQKNKKRHQVFGQRNRQRTRQPVEVNRQARGPLVAEITSKTTSPTPKTSPPPPPAKPSTTAAATTGTTTTYGKHKHKHKRKHNNNNNNNKCTRKWTPQAPSASSSWSLSNTIADNKTATTAVIPQ
ncbi:unnamed protein product, partial [Ectocarpus sp. 4 AP-2014]